MSKIRLQEGFERRYVSFEVRADEEAGVIHGRAAVYNKRSQDLGGFVEVVSPGFFRDVLGDDVRGLFNHDPNLVLGRTKSGTLKLVDGPEGLDFDAFYPDTGLVRDSVLAPLQRGDLDQCSFQFRVGENGDEWEELPDGTVVRTLLPGGCERLADVSVVTFPAYPQTSAEARGQAQSFAQGANALAEGSSEKTGTAAEGQAQAFTNKANDTNDGETLGEDTVAIPDDDIGSRAGEDGIVEDEVDARARLALKRKRLDLLEEEF